MSVDSVMQLQPLTAEQLAIVDQAQQLLSRVYHPTRHTVAAAVLGRSGRVHLGVNIEACGYGPCAEPIALGAALVHAEKSLSTIVAVARAETSGAFAVLPPCGNCRQMLLDYAEHCRVVVATPEGLRTAPVRDLLPLAYRSEYG